MKLAVFPKVIFRTPKFSLADELATCWPQLKESIAQSSDDFYTLIKDVPYEDIASLHPNIQQTIWKYFNRARHRSTPFGTFAAVGVANIVSSSSPMLPIVISPDMLVHAFPDWKSKNQLNYSFDDLKARNGLLFANSTFYRVDNLIRFNQYIEGKFEIVELEADAFIEQLLTLCKHGCPVLKAIEELTPLCDDAKQAEEQIEDLISLQLIFTSLDPNITGEDYFTRIKFMPADPGKKYIISERNCIADNYNASGLKHINSLIQWLTSYLSQEENPHLAAFKRDFIKKYDRQEVPLMAALDPEIGIGYGAILEVPTDVDPLILQFNQQANNQESTSKIKEMLADQLTFKMEEPIRLEKLTPPPPPSDQLVPNTFNCVFTESNGMLIIEHLGGATGTALAGRFTLASQRIYQLTKEIATIEQAANPDCLFFDIVYIAESEVDNVNRRRQIYDYQLSLFNYETSRQAITADDIVIYLDGNTLILKSKSLNRRLIPRLASAYNYSRSDLPIFRLLCDLQHQGLKTNFHLRTEQLFPDLSYYPRLQYHNIILSPAKWSISKAEIKALAQGNMKQYLHLLNTSRHIRTGIADQVLYFDRTDEADMSVLQRFLHKQERLLIEEAFIPHKSIVEDSNGKPYAAQIMATLYHTEQIYQPLKQQTPVSSSVTRTYLPGSEWLYFEIYCHPRQMDNLLTTLISRYIQTNSNLIDRWFFIRYDDGGPHIRLRVRMLKAECVQHFILSMHELIKPGFQQGIIRDLKICVYDREIERYGQQLIAQVEQHFCTDSSEVIVLLAESLSEDDKYNWCLHIAEAVIAAKIPGVGDSSYFSDTILASLQQEHRLKAPDFAEMNKKFKSFAAKRKSCFTPIASDLSRSFVQLLETCPEDKRNRLFMDLFHMHVNRLFPAYQRTHEMTIYYYLMKMSLMQKFRVYSEA